MRHDCKGMSPTQGEQLGNFGKPERRALYGFILCGLGLIACGDYGFTVHVLYSENGRGDAGLNDSSFLGIVQARDETDATVVQWTPQDYDEAGYLLTSVLAEPLRSPDELIILVGETYDDLVSQVECQFRDRKVLHIEGLDPGCTKVQTVDFITYSSAYMAGVAAATASNTGVVSVLGGGLTRDIKEAATGFIDGATAAGALATATYLSASQNGFNNYDEGFRMANEMFTEEQVDVIFVAAGSTGLGVLEAAKQSDNRYVVGYDFDLAQYGTDVVIGSVVKRLDVVMTDAMSKTRGGDFEPGHRETGLNEGLVSFVLNSAFSEMVGSAYLDAKSEALTSETLYREGL